ncbi:MAG TPA: AMP-binding protein [Thermoanaerobaculia bacterium]|nr:AMP-binding protein [Thermoanaerobaculia bacterium]
MIAGDLLGERARLTPDNEALVVVPGGDGGGDEAVERYSWRQLDERATRAAAAWRAMGLAPGDRVAILAHNRTEYVDAFFAAGKCGVVLVTLGTRLTAAELAPIVADSGARVLLWDGALAETAEALRQRCGEAGCGVERWLGLDVPGDEADGEESWPAAVAAADPQAFVPHRADPEDPWCMLYTSGTTGEPKGVVIPHRMVIWNGYNTVCAWQLRADDVSPIFTPMYHAGGLMAFFVPLTVIGGKVVLMRQFDASAVWRTVEAEGCTVVLGVPTIWKLLMEAPEFASADLSAVRWLISGGAPLPTWIADAYRERGVVFRQGFGMTEVGVNCFAMNDDDMIEKPGTLGTPMPFTEVRLVGDDGRDVPVGEVGEMWFRGPHVSTGYWNRPEATAASRAEGGWFRSGDLGRRDEDGYYWVAGRAKDVIISGGVNVFPAEVEAVMLRAPGVRDAALVGVEHPTWGEVGVAFVVPLDERTVDEAALLAFLGDHLARYKLPKEVRLVGELPRTAYGKVQKGKLVEVYQREVTG